MAAAVILPSWSQWDTTYLPLGLPATVRVGLWEYCTEVKTSDNLRLCRDLNTTAFPLWDSDSCVAFFRATQTTAIAAAGLGFLALLPAFAALRLVRGPTYRHHVQGVLLALLMLTLLTFPAAILAFVFWIVIANQTCAAAPPLNGTAWPYPSPPLQLQGYSTSFILAVVASGCALAALVASLAACAKVSRDLKRRAPPRLTKALPASPRADTDEKIAPYVVPYFPSAESLALRAEKEPPDLPPPLDPPESSPPLPTEVPMKQLPPIPKCHQADFPQHRGSTTPKGPHPPAPSASAPPVFIFPQKTTGYSGAASFRALREPPAYMAVPVSSPELAFYFPRYSS
eukprot:GGOE01014258.1.p1 GENE.GGOE01014258.1~~GGOE01014258.1.p1  ORF type:complete len:374 (+),score=73.36 GGOE01014258.1:97-1122(+)